MGEQDRIMAFAEITVSLAMRPMYNIQYYYFHVFCKDNYKLDIDQKRCFLKEQYGIPLDRNVMLLF